MEVKDWKLLRCIYDEMGQYAIEGERYKGEVGDRFEKALAKGHGEVGWIIGKPIKHSGGVTVKVILEGDKDILEYVLRLVQKDWNEECACRLNAVSVAAANGLHAEEDIKCGLHRLCKKFWRILQGRD